MKYEPVNLLIEVGARSISFSSKVLVKKLFIRCTVCPERKDIEEICSQVVPHKTIDEMDCV